MNANTDYSVYLVTDRTLMSTATLSEAVEKAIKGGCSIIQLREKDIDSRSFYEEALKIRQLTRDNNVPLIINDRIDIALAVDADGVHLGQSDIPADIARKLIGKDKILGISARNVAEADQAMAAGADYLGVGAMYATDTKTDARHVSTDTLRAIIKAVPLPVVVIGGINHMTARDFKGIPIAGFSVVSAVISQPDIEKAARELKNIFIDNQNLL